MTVRIKVCGITRQEDALAAVDTGVDALGFNFSTQSRRYCDPEKAREIITALPPFTTTVGVFVNMSMPEVNAMVQYVGLDAVQLHGDETPDMCTGCCVPVIKAIHLSPETHHDVIDSYSVAAILFDTPAITRGGNGIPFDWQLAVRLRPTQPLVLAGGLSPANVAEAIHITKPYAVDVASGVESSPGIKDIELIRRFVTAAREGGNHIVHA